MTETEKIDMLVNQIICDTLIISNREGLDKLIDTWYNLRFTGEQDVFDDVIKEKIEIRFRSRFEVDFLKFLEHEIERKKKEEK